MSRHHDYHVRVGYADIDRMGFVHHSKYWVYLESARTELLRSTGESYASWEERGYLLPLTHSEVYFLSPGHYDDVLTVRTRIRKANRLRLDFEYEVFCEARATKIARGSTSHVFMNKESKAVRATKELMDLLAPFIPPEES